LLAVDKIINAIAEKEGVKIQDEQEDNGAKPPAINGPAKPKHEEDRRPVASVGMSKSARGTLSRLPQDQREAARSVLADFERHVGNLRKLGQEYVLKTPGNIFVFGKSGKDYTLNSIK